MARTTPALTSALPSEPKGAQLPRDVTTADAELPAVREQIDGQSQAGAAGPGMGRPRLLQPPWESASHRGATLGRPRESLTPIGNPIGNIVGNIPGDFCESAIGQFVRNRDQWIVTALDGHGDITAARVDGGGVVVLPAEYARDHVRLGYAATEPGNQSDTQDRSITVATGSTTGRGLYVGMTRGREANHVLVVTDTNDLGAARDLLERVITCDRADVPAVTRREQLVGHVSGDRSTEVLRQLLEQPTLVPRHRRREESRWTDHTAEPAPDPWRHCALATGEGIHRSGTLPTGCRQARAVHRRWQRPEYVGSVASPVQIERRNRSPASLRPTT